jgi:hypothetical protein
LRGCVVEDGVRPGLADQVRRVPRGRVAFLRRYGAFDLAIKAAPFRG